MFENLSEKIDGAFRKLKGTHKITDINIADTLKDIRRALVDADVNYKVAKQFTDDVKEKAMGAGVIKAVNPGQQLVKIVNDELIEFMGGQRADLQLNGNPSVILMAGLQGSGKTTFSGKLAMHLKKKGKRVLLVAADVYRPAAITQLKVLGEQVEVPVYSEEENKNPVQIALNAIAEAKKQSCNVVIIDTAGRLAIDAEMMAEIGKIKEATKPNEILFVVDAMTGQDAVNTAKAFNDLLDFTGVILTKLDGDTRGGAAISIMSVVSKPIKFVGVGEKLDALDVFYPDRMAQRILGMGDIVSFVERAEEAVSAEEAAKMQKKFRKAQFDFEDFLTQLNTIKKMGNIKDLMGMIPGMGKAVKDVDINDDSFKHVEAIIFSMKPVERRNPQLLDAKRKKRIADGSGRTVTEINNLMAQMEQMKKMMKMANNPGAMKQMSQQLKKG